MANDGTSPEDVKKLAQSVLDAKDASADFVENFKESLDLSKRITNSIGGTVDGLKSAKKELSESIAKTATYEKQLEKNSDLIKDIGYQIHNNQQLIAKNESDIKLLEEERLVVIDKLEKINRGILKTMGTMARINGDIAKNEKFRSELLVTDLKNKESQAILSAELLKIEKDMKPYQDAGVFTTEEYNEMLKKRTAILEDQKKNSLQRRSIDKQSNALQSEAWVLSEEKLNLEKRLSRQITAQNSALFEKERIEDDILGIKNENIRLNEENKNFDAAQLELQNENINLQKQKTKELNLQAELQKKISDLSATLLFLKLLKLGYERFVALDKAAEDFRRTTGFSNTQMVELRKNAESINLEFQDIGVGINEVYASAKALTDVFGRTSLVSREAMQNVSLMSVNLGVAAEDSANVLATFQGLGKVTQEAAMNVMKVGASLSEKAGVPFSLVMKDIANASEQTTAMLGANPSKLMKSAIAARALGTDMNKIVSSQRKLLDFSSSINDELELSALLGKSVSFQKARQLAYDGDIAGAAKATLETVKAAGDFESMSVYQREALAKASGMELKDLTKMMAVDKQREEIELRGTDEQKAQLKMQTEALAKLEKENDLSKEGLLAEGEKAIRQQKMQGQMTKLKNIMDSLLVSIGDILEPIITSLATVVVPIFKIIGASLRVTIIPLLKLAAFPLQEIGKLLTKAADKLNEWGTSISGTKDKFKDFFKFFDDGIGYWIKMATGTGLLYALFAGKVGFGAVTKGISSSFGMLKGGLSKIPGLGGLGGGAGAVGKVGDVAKSAKGGGFGESLGKGISSFMKYVADGIGYFGDKKILKGALGIALVGFSIIPFVIAMKMFSGIDWKSVGIGSLALLGFTAAAFGLGALLSTGVGAAIFGAGVIGIAALGAALIPFAAAALMAGVGIKMLGEGIASSVDPILRLSQIDLTKTALGIGAVGVALAAFGAGSAAAGLGSFVGGLLSGDPIKKMERLGAVGEKLKLTAESISAISNVMSTFTVVDSFAKSIDTLANSLSNLNDQVEKISVLKLAAITAISAAGAAATATPAAAANVNMGGVEAKLDTLTNLLTGGAVRVYLDGKDVSAAMTGIGR